MAALSPEDAVTSLLAVSPDHEVRGKKRIQKIIFFCTFCDVPISAHFSIRHFGVFSNEIAGALDLLTTFGEINMRDEQIGPNGYFTTVYSLAGKQKHKLNSKVARVAGKLAGVSTPLLEVASTVAFFAQNGLNEASAERETKQIKPALSTPAQFAKTRTLLKDLAELRVDGDGKRSKNS